MGLMTRLEKPTNQLSHLNNVSFFNIGVVGRPRVFMGQNLLWRIGVLDLSRNPNEVRNCVNLRARLNHNSVFLNTLKFLFKTTTCIHVCLTKLFVCCLFFLKEEKDCIRYPRFPNDLWYLIQSFSPFRG
jgi:hypothetical protein